MLSACSGNAAAVRRKIFQQIRCNNDGCQKSKSLMAELPRMMQPLLFFLDFNSTNTSINNTYMNVRMFSSLPPPPINLGGGNTGSGGGNFRRGGAGSGAGNFRLRRPDPRGGFNGGGRGGRGGGGGGNFGRGRGGGNDYDDQGGSRNRDFGLGGSDGGGRGGRNSPPSLNKKNIFGNPEPFVTAEKGTRTNALTLFPGNYDDENEGYSDTEYGFDDNNNNDNDEADADSTTLSSFVPDDPNEIARQKMLKEHILNEQEKREKWIDNALPPERVSLIDMRGRAYGRGGRKRAQARVWIQPGLGEVIVNRRRFTDYFDRLYDREQVLAPFVATETCNRFDVQIMVKGGGLTGQAGAIRLGVARALNAYNPELYRPPLKLLGYLTRDPRKVERKKIGHTKARKSPQWVRR